MAFKKALPLVMLFAAVAAQGQNAAGNVIGEVYSGEAALRGTLLRASSGMPVLSGGQVSAGDGSALVKLQRGGQLRVCPKTNLALSADPVGKSMVLGLNVGAMELNYSLAGGADLLLTPDLQLQLISPGTFHQAVSVGSSGATCESALPGRTSAGVDYQMIGNDPNQIGAGNSEML